MNHRFTRLYSKERKNEFSLQGKLGLINYGDSSFVNAIIQALSNIEQLCFIIRTFPSDVVHSIGCIQDMEGRKKRSDVFFALRALLRELWTDKRVVIEPAILIRRMNQLPILKDAITNANIEDTFVYLLECLHECLQQPVPPQFEPRVNLSPNSPVWSLPTKGVGAYQRSVISDTLQGILTSVMTCKSCGYEDKRMDAFLVLRIDLVKLSSRSDSAGIQAKNASSHYTKKTSRKLVTQQTTDETGRNRMVTLLKRVASMTEAQFENHQAAHENDNTISGKIMKFIRSHTKAELPHDVPGAPINNHSKRLSFRSNRVAVDPVEHDLEAPSPFGGLDAAVVASLNAPTDVDDQPHQRLLSVAAGKTKGDLARLVETQEEQALDPNEAKDCEDESPLRSSGDHLVSLSRPKIISNSVPVQLPPLLASSLTAYPSSLSSSSPKAPKKRRIIKKLSKSGSFSASAEGGDSGPDAGGGDGGAKSVYKNPMEYIRQNSSPSPSRASSRANSMNSKELRSSPSLPMNPESKLSFPRKHKENNFIEEEELNLEITSMKLPLHHLQATQLAGTEAEEEEEKVSCCSTPLTPTRYDRKTSMKLDSAPHVIRTPRDKQLPSKPVSHQKTTSNSEGESGIHSSESLIPEIDPFSWQFIKDQLLTSMQNGVDDVLETFGLRHYGSTISLSDCFQSTFSPTVFAPATLSLFFLLLLTHPSHPHTLSLPTSYLPQINTQACSHCHHKTPIQTTKTLSSAPEVLVLYFDRFVNIGWKNIKIKNLVSFPLTDLDVTDFIDPHSHYFEPSFKQNTLYDLHAVIEHIGTDKTRNRYITIAKHFPEEKWFEYDDHLVREISESNLLKREVLFLFYVKKKVNSETTHLGNHEPLGVIQERCHEKLERRMEDIVREKKYIASVAKRSSVKKRHHHHHHQQQQQQQQHGKGTQGKGQQQQGNEDRQEKEKGKKGEDDGMVAISQKDSGAPSGDVAGGLGQGRGGCGKWEIVRNNLSTIRRFQDSPNRLKANSKWQIIQRNLPVILAMKGDLNVTDSNHRSGGQEEGALVLRQQLPQEQPPPGEESQSLQSTEQERKTFQHFIQTSFRKSEKLFFANKTTLSPHSNPTHSNSPPRPKRNLLHSMLKSSLFSILYLDDNDPQTVNQLDPSHLIPNTLPPFPSPPSLSCLVFVSAYWIMKFLSFSDPGQLCNHDIACSHGYLKPHLHGAKKYLCVPIELSLLVELEQYLHEEFSYPLFTEQVFGIVPPGSKVSPMSRKTPRGQTEATGAGTGSNSGNHKENDEIEHFRFLKSMTPCALCSNDYEKLLQKRSDELERVMIEHVRDGYEEPLPDNLHSALMEETYAEAKRQNKILQLQLQHQKRKNFSTNPRLQRVKLFTKAHYALSSVLRKIQPSASGSAKIGVAAAGEVDLEEEEDQPQPLQSQAPSLPHTQQQSQPQSPLLRFQQQQQQQPLQRSEDDEVNPTQGSSSFKLKPKFQRELSLDSTASASTPASASGSAMELKSFSSFSKRQHSLAKVVRKISSFSPNNSRVPFTKFYPNAPILSIRPLSEISYCCIIHAAWFMNWKRYIQSGLFEDIEYPILEPGPISNYLLLKHSSRYSKYYQAMRKMKAQATAETAAAGIGAGARTVVGAGVIDALRVGQFPQPNISASATDSGLTVSPTAHSPGAPLPKGLPSVVMNHLLKPELHLHSDYLVVSPNVWKLLHEIYGGGPAIYREETSIYSLEYEENGSPCHHHQSSPASASPVSASPLNSSLPPAL